MKKKKVEIDLKMKTMKKLTMINGAIALFLGLYVILNIILPEVIKVPNSWLPVMLAVYTVLCVSCIVTYRVYLKLKRESEAYL